MAKQMSNGMVKIYDKEGRAIEVFPIDARDHLKSGLYFGSNPKLKKSVSKMKKVIKVDDNDPTSEETFKNDGDFDTHFQSNSESEQKWPMNVDLDSLGHSELIEFAEEKFKVELSNRFGEKRLRVEIEKLFEQYENEQKGEDEDEDSDGEEINLDEEN